MNRDRVRSLAPGAASNAPHRMLNMGKEMLTKRRVMLRAHGG